MAIGGVNVGQELLNVPMGDMIRSMALAIAQAQWELDKSSMTVTELMSGQRLLRDLDTGKLLDKDGKPTGQTTQPIIIDSRVYFGYTYATFDVAGDGKIAGATPTAEQAKAIKDATGKDVANLTPQDKETLKKGIRVPQRLSMVELGFVPTFYQFVETIIEVRISISIHGSTDDTRSSTASASTQQNSYSNSGYWWWYNQGAHTTNVSTSQVNASYSSKYSYDVTGSSFLRTKLVPVPPPPILEVRIRELMDIERAYLLGNPEKAKEPVR
ncbi:MAG: hypothetical protein ACT4QB_21950 [Gammaproteobacteria bacterium]